MNDFCMLFNGSRLHIAIRLTTDANPGLPDRLLLRRRAGCLCNWTHLRV